MIKTLAKSIRQYKRESILAPILVTCEVTLECLIPLYMITMLDGIEADPSIGNILTYGAILLVLAVFSLMFGMLAGNTPRRRPPDSRAICGTTYIIRYRTFRFPISTSSPRPASSRV